jgi:hypothetical protein
MPAAALHTFPRDPASSGRGGVVRAGLVLLALVLGVMGAAGEAAAASARVRFAPTLDPRVVAYDVWVRPAGSPYTTPRRATPLTNHDDGSVSYVVDGLSTTTVYYFAVTAITGDAKESRFSDELPLGDVDPCRTDRCTSRTGCDFAPRPDGSFCSDGVFCNGAETCNAGACVPGATVTCDDGIECTVDACDEQANRCSHQGPAGCCTACESRDPCGIDACAAGLCVVPDGQPFHLQKVKIVGNPNGSTMLLKGSFTPTDAPDPALDGASFEIQDPNGASLYRVNFPEGLIVRNPRPTNPGFRFVSSKKKAAQYGGMTVLDLKIKGPRWIVTMKGETGQPASTFARPDLAWVLSMGDKCVRRVDMPCRQYRRTITLCEEPR